MATTKSEHNRLGQEIVKIVLSFLLLSVAGSLLTYLWQKEEFIYQTKIEQRNYEREQATILFEEISKQMARQLSNFKLSLLDSSFKQKCQVDYLEWNENNTRFKALTKKYFGNDPASISFMFISDQFKLLFEELILNKKPETNSNLGTLVNKLEMDINGFNEQLIDDLLNGRIGNSKTEKKN
ncbi:MAG: hypothetical protein K0M40_00645 [Prolixibacteraceae bacterium]|nr:hypothetical protein [Prolixibacteraceae bacterium]